MALAVVVTWFPINHLICSQCHLLSAIWYPFHTACCKLEVCSFWVYEDGPELSVLLTIHSWTNSVQCFTLLFPKVSLACSPLLCMMGGVMCKECMLIRVYFKDDHDSHGKLQLLHVQNAFLQPGVFWDHCIIEVEQKNAIIIYKMLE